MKSERVSVTSTVTPVMSGEGGHINYAASGIISNLGTNDVYLGGADVTTANGFLMTTTTSPIGIDLVNETLYAVCAAAETATISVLRRGS